MQPKNNTALPTAQEMLLTSRVSFHTFDCEDKTFGLLEVRPGAPVIEALRSGSNLLGAVTSILDRFLDEGMSATEIYGVRMLVESAKAFVDSGTYSVEFGHRQGGEA